MKVPRIADLFCGAGGAGMGLQRAGFDVVGFDIVKQPRYPFAFVQQDALTVDLSGFDAVWASPPCQRWSRFTPIRRRIKHPDLILPSRVLLEASRLPWIIENVPLSPLRAKVVLNGAMFGSCLIRERLFESNVVLVQPWYQPLPGAPLHFGGNSEGRRVASKDELAAAMGIDWMTRYELSQAVPPAYSEFLGRHLLKGLRL